MWFAVDHSELVKIFLWEKNIDAAWEAAQERDCRAELWLALAAHGSRRPFALTDPG